ncbi:MAG: hypothetical protein AB1722_11080 [Pseudomonadota bacterium]
MQNKPAPTHRNLAREQLIQHAARLMAEGGIVDPGLAKRKAARQLGNPDTHNLPSDVEIEVALRQYRALFQADTHPVILRQLREVALQNMLKLEPFHPYLTGSVLSGTAGADSDINLQLFSDDAKAILLFLLQHKMAFDSGEWRTRIGGHDEVVPSYTLTNADGIQTHIAVLPERARFSGSRHPETHADIAAVEKLLAT